MLKWNKYIYLWNKVFYSQGQSKHICQPSTIRIDTKADWEFSLTQNANNVLKLQSSAWLCKSFSVAASCATHLAVGAAYCAARRARRERKMGPEGRERWGGKKLFQIGRAITEATLSEVARAQKKQGLIWNHNKLDLAGMGRNERRSGWRRRRRRRRRRWG